MTRVYIFGEAHNSPENIAYITERIRAIRPKIILHELLYTDIVTNDKVLRERLANCNGTGPCDPKLNKDIYELGLEIRAQLIGIDITVRSKRLAHRLKGREQHMLSMIERYMGHSGPVVVVVGDIHLREQPNPELGDASVLQSLNRKATIERCPLELREAP
jgi:hypothetical protein